MCLRASGISASAAEFMPRTVDLYLFGGRRVGVNFGGGGRDGRVRSDGIVDC